MQSTGGKMSRISDLKTLIVDKVTHKAMLAEFELRKSFRTPASYERLSLLSQHLDELERDSLIGDFYV